MKRKFEVSSLTKRLPKLFSGKRSSSEREGDGSDQQQTPSQPITVGNPQLQTRKSSNLNNTASSTTPSGQQQQKQSSNTQSRDLPAAPSSKATKASSSATSQEPAISMSKIRLPMQRATTDNQPKTSFEVAQPLPLEAPLPSGSIESLDDFSLRRLLDKRLFAGDSSSTEMVLAIRLSPITSVTTQLASSISRVLSKDEKKKREVLVVFTRLPELRLHGVLSTSSSTLAVSWSFPLKSLLAVREQKRGAIVLQFSGGKERKITPVSEIEKGWLLYCTSRLSREFAGADPTVVTLTSLKLVATEESLNARCPFLAKSAPASAAAATAASNKSTLNSDAEFIRRQTDISFGLSYDQTVEDFDDTEKDAEEADEMQATNAQFGTSYRSKRASEMITEQETLILNKTFAQTSSKSSGKDTLLPEQLIVNSKAQLAQLEKDTLNELRTWEAGEGPVIAKKSVTDVDHGRRGDPIASLLAYLEEVDSSLRELDDWMNNHDSSVTGMTTVARKIDSEIRTLREEGAAKEKLASHLTELMEDLSADDEQCLSELNGNLILIQRECESFQGQHPVTNKLIRTCKAICALRDRGGQNSKLYARRERFKKAVDRAGAVGAKLAEFIQSRLDYYYKYERTDVREAHGRLATYTELLKCLAALSPAHFQQVKARYQAEAGLFAKTELTKLLDGYFTSSSSSPADNVSKYTESVIDSSEALRFEQENAVKEVHMVGVESRRKLFYRIQSLIKEEESFCQALGCGFDFAPGISLALDALWQSISSKAANCPISLAAPLLCDAERLARRLERDEKSNYSVALRDRLVVRVKDILDRFIVEHTNAFFEKTKRAQPVFVKKFPGIVDRFEAAAKGFGDRMDKDAELLICPGVKPITENLLQLIATLPSAFHRLENLYFLSVSVGLRKNMALENIAVDIKNKFDGALGDVVSTLLDSTALAQVANLVKSSDEDDAFAISRSDLDEAVLAIQGNLEKSVLQARTVLDTKITIPKLRGLVVAQSRDVLVDYYWRFSEIAAENFGMNVHPTAVMVKDAWSRL